MNEQTPAAPTPAATTAAATTAAATNPAPTTSAPTTPGVEALAAATPAATAPSDAAPTGAAPTDAAPTSASSTSAAPAVKTPAKAWQEMVRGNERFTAGTPRHPRQGVERREELATVQRPDAALFGCSDSRLAAEIIFDKGIGDLFVVRNAGQVISSSVIGSLEYAVGVLRVPLIVVLGHDQCGAVHAAIEAEKPETPPLPHHIAGLVKKIAPAVHRVVAASEGPVDPLVVGKQHLRDTIGELLERSELISDAVAAGTLAVVGANYRLLEGEVVPDLLIGDL